MGDHDSVSWPTPSTTTPASSPTALAATQGFVGIRVCFHVLWQGKYMIHTLSETKIITSSIFPNEEVTPTSIQWMEPDLESLDPSTNLFIRLSVTLLEQVQQNQIFILHHNTTRDSIKRFNRYYISGYNLRWESINHSVRLKHYTPLPPSIFFQNFKRPELKPSFVNTDTYVQCTFIHVACVCMCTQHIFNFRSLTP